MLNTETLQPQFLDPETLNLRVLGETRCLGVVLPRQSSSWQAIPCDDWEHHFESTVIVT